ncbi:hypothetical protein LCGC14_2182810, partial [marine sediment metagenome]
MILPGGNSRYDLGMDQSERRMTCRAHAGRMWGWLWVLPAALVFAGCRPPAVTFPAEPVSTSATRADYDTDGDGKADFFLLAGAEGGRFDRIAYDRDGDGRVTINEAQKAASKAYTAADPTQHPQHGGDDDVNQELHDDLGEASRKTFGEHILDGLNYIDRLALNIANVFSDDPNEKVGPQGAGEGNFLPQVQPFQYTIYFENDPEKANAPAQVVTVTDQLPAELDWSTFELKEVSFGDHTVELAGSATHAWAQVYAEQLNLVVDIEAELDTDTGLVTWTFRSLDPITLGETLDPLAGFLPPNNTKPEGEGHVVFTISPAAGLADGTAIANGATIVFDSNDPIVTNTHVNTFDFAAPTSSVGALGATVPTASFDVQWSGDDAGGSGIAHYDVYVSVDGGPFQVWLDDTTDTSAAYAGQDNSSYAFYTVATDNVGHTETDPGAADTATTVDVNDLPTIGSLTATPEPVFEGDDLTLTANGVADVDGSVVKVEFFRDDNADGIAQPGEKIGEDTDPADGFGLILPAGWPIGNYTVLAVAHDDRGGLSTDAVAPASVAGTIAERPGILVDFGNDIARTVTFDDPDGTVGRISAKEATGQIHFLGQGLVATPGKKDIVVTG